MSSASSLPFNPSVSSLSHQQIHAKALEVASRHQRTVSETIDILQELDAGKTYVVYECTSLYRYAVQLVWLRKACTAADF